MKINKQTAAAISKELAEGSEEWHLDEKNRMYQALFDRFGLEVDELIKQAIGERTQKTWAKIADMLGSNSLNDFTKILFDPLTTLGWEYTKTEKDNCICYNITKCPKAELAKKLGAEKLMFLIACETDCYSAKGFNEKIEFYRTKTLMEGHDCCDHTYCFRDESVIPNIMEMEHEKN